MSEKQPEYEPDPASNYEALPDKKKTAVDWVADEVIAAVRGLVSLPVIRHRAKKMITGLESSLKEKGLNENFIPLIVHRIWTRREELFNRPLRK